MSENLVVKDSEFETVGKNIKKFSTNFEAMIREYYKALVSLSENEITSGKTHDALVVYIGYVQRLLGKTESFGSRFQSLTTSYIKKIDNADRYLYEKGGHVARDFTEEERKKLEDLTEDNDSWWSRMWDGVGDFFLNMFGKKDVTDPRADIEDCHRALLDLNNATKKTIKDIWDAVYRVESKYGMSISGGVGNDDYYTSNLAACSLFFYSLETAFYEMADIIDPNGKPFTVESIENSLNNLFDDIDKYYEHVISIINSDADITIEIIEDFVNNWASTYFNKINGVITEFLGDIGGKEYAMMIIFNMFGISEDQLLTGDSAKHYIKIELMSLLDEMAESYVYDESDEKQIVSKFKEYIDLLKKYGDDWYNAKDEKGHKLFVDGRTREGKAFKKFIDGLGGASEILKYGDDVIEVLAKYFTDYTKNSEILDAFLENASANDDMAECAKEIAELYNKELNGIIKEALNKIDEIGLEALKDLLAESLPPAMVIKTIEKVIDVTGEITGLGEQYQSMYDALIYNDMYYSAAAAYDAALEKVKEAIKNGINSGEEYDKLIENLKYNFNLTKNIAVKMFKKMALASTGTKRSYYEYCAYLASEASMADQGKLELPSYEEYMKSF